MTHYQFVAENKDLFNAIASEIDSVLEVDVDGNVNVHVAGLYKADGPQYCFMADFGFWNDSETEKFISNFFPIKVGDYTAEFVFYTQEQVSNDPEVGYWPAMVGFNLFYKGHRVTYSAT